MTSLQRLIDKPLQGYPFSNLASLTWSRSLPATSSGRPAQRIRTQILGYATYKGFGYYLQHQIELNRGRIPSANGCPLLLYAVLWNSLAARLSFDELKSPSVPRIQPLELLLQHGANPNETYEGRAPWSELLRLFRNYLRDDTSYQRSAFALDVLCAGLDVARQMLHHGADPSYDEAVDGAYLDPDRNNEKKSDFVSTRIFGELLEENCCMLGSFADCSCADARLFTPKFAELVELVERKKVEKRLGWLVHLGWLGVQMARLLSVSYYVWAGLVALLAGALLVLFEGGVEIVSFETTSQRTVRRNL